MGSNESSGVALRDATVDVRLKLSGLWASTTLCYIYGDLFGFFKRQTLTDIVAGKAGLIGTQSGLLAAAISVTIPSVMVALSILLKPAVGRWANVVLGAVYAVIALAGMPGAWTYYVLLGVVEAVLTLLIVWYAWRWPKERAS